MRINGVDSFDDDELKARVSILDDKIDASIEFVVRYGLSVNK